MRKWKAGPASFIALSLIASCSDPQPSAAPNGVDGGAGNIDGGAGNVDGGAPDDGPSNTPGKHVHEPDVEGIARELVVYVPEKARGKANAPVVFMFHGTSGSGETAFGNTRWKEKADAEGLVAVYPSSLTYCIYEDDNRDGAFTADERRVTTKWSSGQLGDPNELPLCTADEIAALPPEKRAEVDHPVKDDILFVREILDLLARTYSIDAKRIYAAGFSNGGAMTSRLLVELSDRFAAAASNAGPMQVTPAPGRRIAFMFALGQNDPKFTSGAGVQSFTMSEAFVDDPVIKPRLVTPYLTTMSLGEAHTYVEKTVAAKKISHFTYATSTAGASNSFHFALIEGCAHEYPNGTNHPIDMTDIHWEFFENEKLP